MSTAIRDVRDTAEVSPRVHARARRLATSPLAGRTLAIVGAIVAWQLCVSVGIIDPLFVSSPLEILDSTRILGESHDLEALAVSGKAIALAFALGTASGLLAGLLIGLSRTLRDAYFGSILFLMSTPKAIFIPIFLLIFGASGAAYAFGTFEVFFYVAVNVVGGVEMTDDRHRTMAHAYGGSRLAIVRHVVLPTAMPGIFNGIWYGLKHAVLAVVIMELYVSLGGIGTLIRQYTNAFQTGNMMVIVLALSLAAIAAGVAWTRVEKRFTRWRA